MGMTAAQYLIQLQALLPRGAAWTREPEADLTQLLRGLSVELARVDERCDQLVKEMDPHSVTEMIDDWETTYGLPDPCTGPLATLAERRAALAAKVSAIGAASPAYFIALAASIGYAVTIDENVDGDQFKWRVNSDDVTIRYFRAGQGRAGERLRTWGNQLLECVIRKYSPAHTEVVFGYGG